MKTPPIYSKFDVYCHYVIYFDLRPLFFVKNQKDLENFKNRKNGISVNFPLIWVLWGIVKNLWNSIKFKIYQIYDKWKVFRPLTFGYMQ